MPHVSGHSQYGHTLSEAYNSVSERFKRRARELMTGVYPREYQPSANMENRASTTTRAQRYVWAYLWARVVAVPLMRGSQIPLSPNWRLASEGAGIKLLPNVDQGSCGFVVVDRAQEQSPGTVRNGIATCPYPNCGATTPRGYISSEAQAGRLGHQLYCVIYRDQWWPLTKAGKPSKRPKTQRGFRVATAEDDNSRWVTHQLEENMHGWVDADIFPSEAVPSGNKTNEPVRYGMVSWRDMFSPRQQLAHGYCVQAFRELVDEDRTNGTLTDIQRIAWCYVALGFDKLLNRNSLLSRWVPKNETVVGTFDSHDFGMKWSYAEMAVTIEGLGLDWALDEVGDCIGELVKMSGWPASRAGLVGMADGADVERSIPTERVNAESADLLLAMDNDSVDAIVFDPPYYDNVAYAELSDYFYVWLKRTAGYVFPEWFDVYLTDKDNEAIANQARFKANTSRSSGGKSVKVMAYDDYVGRMRRIFDECRRIIKDDGIMTIMFTHKTTDAWDALTIGIIEAGFRITATWPVKTESDSSLNIRDRAAARSTILLACRPKTGRSAGGSSWEQVEREIAAKVRERLPQLEVL